jgi:hypothetical protein
LPTPPLLLRDPKPPRWASAARSEARTRSPPLTRWPARYAPVAPKYQKNAPPLETPSYSSSQ